MTSEPRDDRAVVLVGGVGQLYQGDLDVGRRVVDVLAREPLGDGIRIEDLHFGAVAVTQLLEDVAPETLVLVGAEARGRPPATIERRRIEPAPRGVETLQAAVGDAVTGYVTIDLVIDVAHALGALPPRVLTIEVEPSRVDPSEALTPEVADVFDELLALARIEARRAPLFGVADRLRVRLEEGRPDETPAVDALRELLAELRRVEEDTRWGRSFTLRERLRGEIAAGRTGEGMDHLDWSLWWALIEELDRLQTADVEALEA